MNPATANQVPPSSCTHLNLACGTSFVTDQGWINVDFSPSSSQVLRLNLLDQLPFSDSHFQVIYSSHFLEHVPIIKVQQLLRDWHRLLNSGGKIRLVLPDFQILAHRYVKLREASRHQEADAILILAVDQCVMRYQGGMLKDLYHRLAGRQQSASRDVLADLDGVQFSGQAYKASTEDPARLGIRQRLIRALSLGGLDFRRRRWEMKLALALLPRAFVEQNISFAATGELHQWLWDEHQLSCQLASAGFEKIEGHSTTTSGIVNFRRRSGVGTARGELHLC